MFQIISPVSIIICGYIIYILSKRNIKIIFVELLALTLMLEITTSMGYFIKIGTFDISLCNGVSLITLFFALILIFNNEYDKTLLHIGFLFLLSAIMGLLLFIVRPYEGRMIADVSYWDYFLMGMNGNYYRKKMDSSSLMGIIILVKWFIILGALKGISKDTSEYIFKILNSAANLSKIALIYGVIEFIFKNLFKINTTPFLLMLFGESGAQFNGSLIRGNAMQKIGMFTETSFYAYGLFLLCIMYLILMNYYKNKDIYKYKKMRNMFVIGVLLLSVTFSFFVIIGLPLLYVAYIVTKKEYTNRKLLLQRTIKAVVLMIVVFAFLIIAFKLLGGTFYDYYLERVLRTFENLHTLGNLQTGYIGLWTSETTRLTSIVECLKIFMSRPILGVGIRITDCHSTVVSLLTTMGVVGFLCWICIIKRCAGRLNIIFVLLFVAAFFMGGGGLIFNLSFAIFALGFEELGTTAKHV